MFTVLSLMQTEDTFGRTREQISASSRSLVHWLESSQKRLQGLRKPDQKHKNDIS